MIDVDVEKERVLFSIQILQEQRQNSELEISSIQAKIDRLREELAPLDEEALLLTFGFYKPHYDFILSEQYQEKLKEVRTRQKEMLNAKTAAVCLTEWTVNGSKTEGRKQTNQTLKLLIRAFNGECDAAVAKVKYNNVQVMESRIKKSLEQVNSLVETHRCEITSKYLDLKLEELYLVYEYQEKVQNEKEEQRRIREQMREEELAQKELEKAQLEAEREEKRYQDALNKARDEMQKTAGEKQQLLLSQITELQRRLEEAHTNKERVIARAQMTRSGHVYIISNIGSFGENIYKIGMTRRLDPMDRVKELGDASVPFQFDVHAIIYAEDAPALETALHQAFRNRRVNRINERKEFFQVKIEEIVKVVHQHKADIEIIREAEAKEYRQTLAMQEAIVSSII